jgi:hypothetical protein
MSQNDNLIQVKYMFPNFKSDVYECQTQINLTVFILIILVWINQSSNYHSIFIKIK